MPSRFAYPRLLLGFCGMAILGAGSILLAQQIRLDLTSFGPSHVMENPITLILFVTGIVILLSIKGKPNYVDFICDGHRNITIHRFQNIFQNTFQNIFQETFVGIITTAAVHVRIYRHFIHNVLRKDHKVFEKNWDAVNYRMLSDSPGTAIKGANIDASRLHQFADRCRQSMINRDRHRQHYMPHKMCVPVHSV